MAARLTVLGLIVALSIGGSYCELAGWKDGGLPNSPLLEDNNLPIDPVSDESSKPLWPLRDAAYGDISSVAVHPSGELFILHRGPHRWSEDTFNGSNIYQNFHKGAIPEDVLVGIDDKTGEQLHSWGRKRFFMPHGLTIDGKGFFWITDVALHQVFKISPTTLEIVMTLGVAGVPGSDKSHFCKPTDVAVAADGTFFVADGYCNSRVIKFSSSGEYLSEFGRAGDASSSPFPASADILNIPHSLALVEDYNLICVANREDEKIQCFSAGQQSDSVTGKFVLQVAHPALSRVFAIHYAPAVKRLYAVSGMGFSLEDKPISVFSIDLTSNSLSSWNPADAGVELVAPHDLTVSNDGQYIYVADLSPQPTVWKFDNTDLKLAAE